MKEIIICRNDKTHTALNAIRLSTKPSGDLELSESSYGSGESRPSNHILGVIPKAKIPEVIGFLKENQ
jgi:hypothetical protein